MKKRLLLIAGLLTALVAISLLIFPSDEPAYQGKSLSRWMRELNTPDQNATRDEVHQRSETFTNVVRALGTNALPFYLELLDKDSRPAWQAGLSGRIRHIPRTILRLLRKQPSPPGTIKAFEILGPVAKPALPALARLLADVQTSDQAAACLAAIGPEAIPILTNAVLTTTNPLPVRAVAAESLGNISPPLPAVLPVLYTIAQGNQPGLANVAFEALAKAETNTTSLLPLLAKRLANTNTAYEAAVVLRRLGKPGLPLLEAALTNHEPAVRMAAEAVLGPATPTR